MTVLPVETWSSRREALLEAARPAACGRFLPTLTTQASESRIRPGPFAARESTGILPRCAGVYGTAEEFGFSANDGRAPCAGPCGATYLAEHTHSLWLTFYLPVGARTRR